MSSTNTTSMEHPPGYLEHYDPKAHIVLGLAIAFIVVEIGCVALRFLARRIGKVPWGADDFLIIPGLIFCLGVCAGALVDVTKGGVGHHLAALEITDPEKIVVWAKLVVGIPIVYLAAVLFPKLAILAIYLRIFTKKPYRRACYALAVLLIANWIATTVAGLLVCIPLHYLWDRTVAGGHCFDINAYFRWSSLVNIVTDVIMLVLPLPVIWKIHTSRNIKIGLTFTFATGSVGLITSVIRFATFFDQNAAVDGTYSATSLVIWTICESGTYLIAACLPTYRPLALLLWNKSPLSALRTGSTANTLIHPHSLNDGSTSEKGAHKDVGFRLYEEDRITLAGPYAASHIESGGFPEGDAQNGRNIMVRHDIDVSSSSSRV